MEYKGHVNQLRFNFPLMNCRVGEIYEAVIRFEVTETSKRGATVDILDLKTESRNKSVAQVIPSPS